MNTNREVCHDCGSVVTVGEWPYCPHGKPTPSKGFEPYFDVQLGAQINTPGDRNKLMRPHWKDDYMVHLAPNDKPAAHYRELNERRAERRAETLKGKR